MAKNAPVKKPKRRLKRSVRRSLAAVLMITAIGVAAIPVPENYAEEEDAGTTSSDVHKTDTDGFKYNSEQHPYQPEKIYNSTGTAGADGYFNLDVYKDEKDKDVQMSGTKGPAAVASLATTDVGNGQYSLSWQFLFYEVTEPISKNKRGVISLYNNEYSAEELTLEMAPVTKYYTVEETDYAAYYSNVDTDAHAKVLANMRKHATSTLFTTVDPFVEYQYKYSDFGKEETNLGQYVWNFFENYCPGVEAKREEFQEYKDWEDANKPDPQRSAPEPLKVVPVSVLNDTQRLSFYCDNDTTIKGTGYALTRVSDSRPKGRSTTGYVYLAHNGIPNTEAGAKNDTYGFLYTETSGYLMCAVGAGAFKGITNVVNLTLPTMIGYIGDEAFMGANLMESIEIANVTNIGNRAFKDCVSLSRVSFAQGTEIIGAECFSGTAIQSLDLPTSTQTIGYGAFSDCLKLTSLNLNNMQSASIVKDFAFHNCTALTNIAMADSNIRALGFGAFSVTGSSQSMDIVMPQRMSSEATINDKNVNSIGDYLFAGRANLKTVVFPPDYGRNPTPKTEIPYAVFHGCFNLHNVEFPATDSDQFACGYVTYDFKTLFKDVTDPDFYVKGPKANGSGLNSVAYPREATWDAVTAVSDTVPYLYIENGVEYYEVSDGYYLLCINNKGVLTSCTFKSDKATDWDLWAVDESKGGKGGKLVIPPKVGNTKVVGIASGCFSDTQLNRRVKELVISDNSVTSIDDGVFRGGGGPENKDWLALKKVYIGNAVTSIGNNAFYNCKNLSDVTFASPLGGHESFTIGTDAFKTNTETLEGLTFHGDIVVGYAPFKIAMDPDNTITDDGMRICYKSLSPSYLMVMYNPITKMVTLLDYPKYEEINSLLNAQHADEIAAAKVGNYQEWREYTLYNQFGDPRYDNLRHDFAGEWKTKGEEAYNSVSYGPWVNPDFCKDGEWEKWIIEDAKPDTSSADISAVESIADWLFEPIVAYAAENDPDPYYKKNPYVVTKVVDIHNDYFPSTTEEQKLVDNTKNIVIPEGVESIDVYGYVNNLTAEGEKYGGAERNSLNVSTYLHDPDPNAGWDSKSRDMYENGGTDEAEKINIVPGLFSGLYEDGDAAPIEDHPRGNDVITTVTMHSVKYLPDYAFDSCESLWHVTLGPDCADIGKAPFRGCNSLQLVDDNEYYTSTNGIIYSVNSDGSYTIEECLSGRGRVVGEGTINSLFDTNLKNVSAIKPGAFEDCDYLSEVNFGNNDTAGLRVIPEDCFRNCDRLSKVTLPMTVNDVGKNSFVGANDLNEIVVYGKEVKISGSAFRNEIVNGKPERTRTNVRTYTDSAVVRYVKEYGDEYNLVIDAVSPLGEIWQVSFYDQNYELITDLKDQEGNDLENPQYVNDGNQATKPQDPPNTDDWTFERWVGMNNVGINDRIHEDVSFYAQGYSNSGMVDGKYPVSFWDGVDGKQVGPIQYVVPGNDAIAPAHPVHTGYVEDGFSEPYTNIQAPKTIIMKYKPTTASGGTTSGGTTSGGTTSGGGTSGGSSSSKKSSSNTSSSGSTSSTSTSNSSTQNQGLYVVTVVGGSGSGSYAAGTTVLIQANAPAAGQVFSKWVTDSQGVSLASVSTTPTIFTMPANNVTITAEFTAGSATPINTGGSSSTGNTGNTNSGNTRVDITKPGISNKDLATANVNGSTDSFVVKITETDEATRAVAEALTNKYGSLDNILYYAMDISLYDSTGTVKITDTSGLSVDITIPIPDALVAYGGNNKAGAVINGNQLESLNENFTVINGVPCIRFTATHFSPYTIYVDTGNLTEGMLDVTPKTGDPIHPKWFLSLGLACLSVILFIKKDKTAKVKTA